MAPPLEANLRATRSAISLEQLRRGVVILVLAAALQLAIRVRQSGAGQLEFSGSAHMRKCRASSARQFLQLAARHCHVSPDVAGRRSILLQAGAPNSSHSADHQVASCKILFDSSTCRLDSPNANLSQPPPPPPLIFTIAHNSTNQLAPFIINLGLLVGVAANLLPDCSSGGPSICRTTGARSSAERLLDGWQSIVLLLQLAWATAVAVRWPAQMVPLLAANVLLAYTVLGLRTWRALAATSVVTLLHLPMFAYQQLQMGAAAGLRLEPVAAAAAVAQQPDNVNATISTPIGGGGGEATQQISRAIYRLCLLAVVYLQAHALGVYLSRRAEQLAANSLHRLQDYVQAKIELDGEDKKLTKLMESVIPKHLAESMRHDILEPSRRSHSLGRQFHQVYLQSYDNVSILFADIVNFTKISSNCPAQVLVETLNELFGRFDKAADKNKCLRIKILGDCYYCVSGIPNADEQHARRSVEMALDMIDILDGLAAAAAAAPTDGAACREPDGSSRSCVSLSMRVGIHSGRVLCGILGKKKWQFDVHSNDVKLANHTEQSGVPGRVHITEDTLKALAGAYKVEQAYGYQRDSYIAQRNVMTYFVLPPDSRRRSSCLPTMQLVTMSQQPQPRSASRDSHDSVQCHHRPLAKRLFESMPVVKLKRALIKSRQRANSRSSSASYQSIALDSLDPAYGDPSDHMMAPAGTHPTSEAKLRFRQATQRLINAMHFIRTIEAPFANLDESCTDCDKIFSDAVESRRRVDQINRWTLCFKDKNLANLYENTSVLRLILLALASVAFVSLLGIELLYESSDGSPPVELNLTLTSDGLVAPAALGIAQFHKQPTWSIEPMNFVFLFHSILVLVITLVAYWHQQELEARRDFVWSQMAQDDKNRMAKMRDCNKFIFFNLLPPQVAEHFLQSRPKRMELYYRSHEQIGVLFATVSNFGDFYSEVQGNQHGLECLRLLNEIISDFDSLLDEPKFKTIEKIKTIGSTYMAAVGLFEDVGCQEKCRELQVAANLTRLAEFVFDMQRRLDEISRHSYNDFKLRAGLNVGPVTAGVIGAQKAQYDIWGNTVNVASRMESTAEPNRIQITEEVYQLLRDRTEFSFSNRGLINVKGKGSMYTYYLS